MNKRGLSEVVTTVLIILIILAAIIILWIFLRPVIFKSIGKLESGRFTIRLSIVPDSVLVDENQNLRLGVKRNSGEGEIAGVLVSLEDSNGIVRTFRYNDSINELESRIINVDYSDSDIESVKKIFVTPVILNKDGDELIGLSSEAYIVGAERVILTESSAVRELPDSYTQDNGFNVLINVYPKSFSIVYAVEETPPSGWIISNINEEGEFAYGKIRWHIDGDDSRTLTYTATPSAGESGTKTFSGVVYVDVDPSIQITGDSVINSL